ncbi:hypothetical protein SS37A_23490 [Methylocystis iwaonis]|uniref:Uncharacterized protein n=1 Tax=Methylocystis iwaonis TaxID=2885079 RepID=A0ABM8E9Z1_9HYPH|nr:hypothetical protein SS37A_23490 [Methylocystis iwaonis]
MKAAHVIGEFSKPATAEVQDLERISQAKDLPREFGQPRQTKLAYAGEIAATKTLQVRLLKF